MLYNQPGPLFLLRMRLRVYICSDSRESVSTVYADIHAEFHPSSELCVKLVHTLQLQTDA